MEQLAPLYQLFRRIPNVDEQAVDAAVNALTTQVAAQKANLPAAIDERLKGESERLAAIAKDQDAMKADLEMVKAGQDAMKADLEMVKAGQDAMKADLATVKADQDAMKADLATVKADQEVMKADLAVVKSDQEAMKADLAVMKVSLVAMGKDLAEMNGRQKGEASSLPIALWVLGLLVALNLALSIVALVRMNLFLGAGV